VGAPKPTLQAPGAAPASADQRSPLGVALAYGDNRVSVTSATKARCDPERPRKGPKGAPMRYEKAEILVRIALDMQGSALGLSLDDIQRNYCSPPLSRRTAERLRDAAERVFPQIELANPNELPKRWRLPAGTTNGLANVTAEELADLATAVTLLRRENMQAQAEGTKRVISKMRALLKRPAIMRIDPDLEALTEAEGLAMRPGPRPKINADVVGALRQAILGAKKVRLHYVYRGSGKRGFETVHPYGFIYGQRHYLVAWSENERAKDFRSFALSNIECVEPLNTTFNRRRGFSLQAYAERSFGVFQEKPFDVVWRFSPNAAADAKTFLFHPTQTLEDQTDGSLIVRFRAGGAREMCWHLFTWGDEVQVLAPPHLRKLLQELTMKARPRSRSRIGAVKKRSKKVKA
jgi:predicted DNA-binding transcriptional regulator YafY